MSKTLLNARNLVRSYLDETSGGDWSDSELNILINTYFHNVRNVVITTFEDYYVTTALFNTTANRTEYTSVDGIPTDISKIRRIEVNFDPDTTNNSPTRMFPINSIDGIRRDLGQTNVGLTTSTTGSGGYYVFGHGDNMTLGLVPFPTKTGTGAGKIWYIPDGVDLSTDGSAIDIPSVDKNWIAIVYGAVSEALRFGQQDSTEADKFEKKYDDAVHLMQEELEDRVAEESKTISDTTGDDLNFQII